MFLANLPRVRCVYLRRRFVSQPCNLAQYEQLNKIDRNEFLLKFINENDQIARIPYALNKIDGGISIAIQMRNDVMNLERFHTPMSDAKLNNKIRILNSTLKDWLSTTFCYDTLELRRITFEDSCGTVLEKVARGEAVHRVRSLSELKRRLHDGRRCYGLFHKSLPLDPVAFIHIALTDELAPSLRYLHTAQEILRPKCAIFYSITSPIPALSGLEVAARLIKLVTAELQDLYPSIETYSTLSPVPGFLKWLNQIAKDGGGKLIQNMPNVHQLALVKLAAQPNIQSALVWLTSQLSAPLCPWVRDDHMRSSLEDPLMWLGCYYLAVEKQDAFVSNPLDNVARFHLRNGAQFHRLNWMGNSSTDGLTSSAGLMVNYVYSTTSQSDSELSSSLSNLNLRTLSARADEFAASGGNVIMGQQIRDILGAIAVTSS